MPPPDWSRIQEHTGEGGQTSRHGEEREEKKIKIKINK